MGIFSWTWSSDSPSSSPSNLPASSVAASFLLPSSQYWMKESNMYIVFIRKLDSFPPHTSTPVQFQTSFLSRLSLRGRCTEFQFSYFQLRRLTSNGMSCCRSPPSSKSMEVFRIPEYIFKPDAIVPEGTRPPPSCPVIVFINSKSGGQLGGALLQTYAALLNSWQVFDLGKEAPDKVLHSLYSNLETRKLSGDELAKKIHNDLKLIVAGGDGTAGWLLSVLSDLKLTRSPPIATMPLGTGNNLHFAFGWGKKNPGTDSQSVKVFLDQVKNAKEMKIDSWHIIMRMRDQKEGSCDPIALELPRSLHAFHCVSKEDSSRKDGYCTFRGGFWNYFSMGMDAQVSYAFHSERKLHPEKFKKQLFNQITYLKLGFMQGWFCDSLAQNSSRNILADVEIVRTAGQKWEKLEIHDSIRSIVCLNLPSFSGGLNPWGTPNKKKSRDRNLTPAYINDSLLEIVGFRNAWHGLLLLSSKGHGTRLAQAHKIRFKFRKGVAGDTYVRIDGEPWRQPLPKEDDDVVVEISHQGQVNMLATANCRSKSKSDGPMSPSPSSKPHYDYDPDEYKEEKKKFGAADTFKGSKDDIATHLS